MRLRCCLARRRASFSSSVDLRPLHAGMYEEGSASAGRLEDDGEAGDVTDDETELGLREPLLPDSVHTSNVGSMTVVISADIVEGIKSFSTYACTKTRVCFKRNPCTTDDVEVPCCATIATWLYHVATLPHMQGNACVLHSSRPSLRVSPTYASKKGGSSSEGA